MSDFNDFRIKDGVLYEYTGSDPHMVVPDTVTKIADYAFENNARITHVELPDTVTHIGEFAFEKCLKLEDINIPASVKSIGKGAFSRCAKLKEIDIQGNVEIIADGTFASCQKLEKVVLAESVKSIEKHAFYYCVALSDINVSDRVTHLGEKAFGYCNALADSDGFVIINNVLYGYFGNAVDVTVPDNVVRIEDSAFHNCKNIVSVSLPDSLVAIEDYAFWGCESLKSIYLPDSVTSIGKGAFVDCLSLDWIRFGASVRSIDGYPFSGVDLFHEIILPGDVTTFGGSVYEQIWNTMYDTWLKPVVVMSFIKYAPDSVLYDPAIFRKIKANKKIVVAHARFYEEVEVIAKLFSWYKKISLDELDSYISDADEATASRAFFMDYKNSHYTVTQQKNSEELKTDKELGLVPLSVAEYKKLYRYDVTEKGIVITSYKGDDTEIVIPAVIGKHNVIAIGDYCFSPSQPRLVWEKRRSRGAITAITIPDSVSEIGNCVFDGCEKITLYVSKNSYAEEYSKKNKIPFIAI